MIFLILNNELQKRYVLSKSPSNKISIKKIPNKRHIYLSLILISLGILIYKIGAFAFTVASKKTDNILLKVKPQKELEYYIDDEMIIDDIIYTLLPSCVNLLVSSFSFYFEWKLPKEIEWTNEIVYLTSNINNKKIIIKAFLTIFMFFLPLTTISVIGIAFLIMFLILNLLKKRNYYLQMIFVKFFCVLIFLWNFIVSVPGFDFIDYDYIGFNGLKSDHVSFQVSLL